MKEVERLEDVGDAKTITMPDPKNYKMQLGSKEKDTIGTFSQKQSDTIVKAYGGGEYYDITVKKGSGYAKMAKKLGYVPSNLRPIDVNKSTDPAATGISSKERQRRLNALNKIKK